MDTVHRAAALRSDGVIGVELSGNPLVGDAATLMPALELARSYGLACTLHCAEVFRPAETSLMLSFRPERLGHMCFLDDATREQLLESAIGVEVCPTSNVVTESTPGYGEHHIGWLMAHSHPLAICTDDTGIFDTTLSREYALVAEHHSLSLSECLGLATAAIDLAFRKDLVPQLQSRAATAAHKLTTTCLHLDVSLRGPEDNCRRLIDSMTSHHVRVVDSIALSPTAVHRAVDDRQSNGHGGWHVSMSGLGEQLQACLRTGAPLGQQLGLEMTAKFRM